MKTKTPLGGVLRRLTEISLLFLGLLLSRPAHGEVPEEGWLIWNSDRQDGRQEIYQQRTGTAHSGEVTRLTSEGGHYPSWSPNGTWIAYFSPSDKKTTLMRWDGSDKRAVFEGLPKFWMHDGQGLVCGEECVNGEHCQRFFLIDPETGSSRPLFAKDDFPHLTSTDLNSGGITHDGRWLVAWVYGLFGHGYTADNGTFTTGHATVLLDLQDKSRLFYLGPGCLSAAPPAGELVYHVSREGATMPDIFRMKISDRMTRASYQLEVGTGDADQGHEYMPAISNDGQWMVYAATDGCHQWLTCDYDVFAHRLGAPADSRERLTLNGANDSFPGLFIGVPGQKLPGPDLGASDLDRRDGAVADLGAGDAAAQPPQGDGCTVAPWAAPASGVQLLVLLLCGLLSSHSRARRRPEARRKWGQ